MQGPIKCQKLILQVALTCEQPNNLVICYIVIAMVLGDILTWLIITYGTPYHGFVLVITSY